MSAHVQQKRVARFVFKHVSILNELFVYIFSIVTYETRFQWLFKLLNDAIDFNEIFHLMEFPHKHLTHTTCLLKDQ